MPKLPVPTYPVVKLLHAKVRGTVHPFHDQYHYPRTVSRGFPTLCAPVLGW